MTDLGGEQPKPDPQVRVAWIGALATISAAVLGLIAVLITAHNPGVASALGGQPSVIVTISPSPSASPSPSPSPSPVDAGSGGGSTPANSGIFNSGTVSIPVGEQIDLDSIPSDHQWGMFENDSASMELGWRSTSGRSCDSLCTERESNGWGGPIVQVNGDADEATCVSSSPYEYLDIAKAKMKTGLTLCAHTTEDRYAVVKVTRFTSFDSPITVHITTYKNATD